MANPLPFATVNHIPLALGIPCVSLVQGDLVLGIGAFGYYRRVVENQKNRILGEILKLAQKIDAQPEMIAALEAAKKETQFSKAMTAVKTAIPQGLLINGQNPLVLLHSALSDGLQVALMRNAWSSRMISVLFL
jgi:hypothetical protein